MPNSGGVIGEKDASHSAAFWHHAPMDGALSALPPHERRRLLALGHDDPEELARRRLAGEPLQYLEGTAAFTDFDVIVDSRVLIPRPETEGLFDLVVRELGGDSPSVVVELGTGSGAIAIALARRFADAAVHATDISEDALDVARHNARRLGVDISFHRGDLFAALPGALRGRVDLLVSNPPYVAEHEWKLLPPDVRREPRAALIAGPRGTEVLERIASGAPEWMAPGGLVACEIGETQGEVVREAFAALGDARIRPDLAGCDRYVVVRYER